MFQKVNKMKNNLQFDFFASYHPIVSLYYFVFVMGFSMFVLHPVALFFSVLCSITYSSFLNGRKNLITNLFYVIPSLIAMALINPAFNHEGATILLYFKNGNPLTLESIYYGIASSSLLITSTIWFLCFNKIMTSDKIIYLFGKIVPIFSLLLSMSMRFVPLYKREFKKITNAQRCIRIDISYGSLLSRYKNLATILSAMIGKSLENAIETSNSMKSRGFGIKGRTSFSIYKMTKRDIYVIFTLISLSIIIVFSIKNKYLYYRYFPTIKFNFNIYSIITIVLYIIFALFPIITSFYHEYLWKIKKIKQGEKKFVATDQFTL